VTNIIERVQFYEGVVKILDGVVWILIWDVKILNGMV